ncbi:MAG: phosphonate ABC transporter ATP-binding protein [Phycisphaerales bacterium]
MPPVLELRNLSKTYPTGRVALEGVHLSVAAGERVAVIGRSGAGKSTMLRLMNRLLAPTGGEILLEGAPITRVHGRKLRDVRTRVGMIFQQFNLVSRLTVLENVLVGWLGAQRGLVTIPPLWRQFPASAREAAMACLEEVQIADLAHQRADQLSGGQAQRVAIARVLAQQPRAILADEPVSSLDPRSSEIVLRTLDRINASHGVPIVVNVHDVEIARRHTDRVVGLRDGRLVLDTPATALDDAELERLYQDPRASTTDPAFHTPQALMEQPA